ncbi:hypothetical protein ANCCEY_15016 [Ancylostoma ceylanicum]|uniref:Uncharacterized protein n=1 Tax=Ancylostoma ceylanicum TaxID=53326 RepID=A0A0D6L8G1_9BILA|nr:hypothetical protein ANCCEY_15016 [Ancylostoma ceylanicum]
MDGNLCLWLFADASKSAMATCAYLQDMHTKAMSQLVSGKTRLSPKNYQQTIPRLELLAILLAMRLGSSILQAVNKGIKEIAVVSDSEIALCWLKTQRKMPIFVANQRDKILKLKMQFEKNGATVRFFHVATDDNPADAGTRGLTAKEIGTHDWVQGPSWMKNDPTTWSLKSMDEIESADSESQYTEVGVQNVEVSKSIARFDPVIDLSRFSKLDIALRAVTRVAKFLRNTIDQLRKNRGIDININAISQFELRDEISAQDISAAERLPTSFGKDGAKSISLP